MCVSTSGMETQSAKTAALADTLTADFGSRFADQTQILNQLKSTIQGPSGRGFSSAERSAYESTALTSSAAANIQAQRAIGAYGAGMGGGGTGAAGPSGILRQLQAQTASQQAAALVGERLGIESRDWATGREEKQRKIADLLSVSGQEAPAQYAQLAGQERGAAYGAAKDIYAAKQAKTKAIAGMLTSAALGAATFGAGGIANLGAGESFGEGVGDFFKGGVGALSGQDLLSSPIPSIPTVSDPGFGIDIPGIG